MKYRKKELLPKYQCKVMPETDYYPREFGRLKSQLLMVENRRKLWQKI